MPKKLITENLVNIVFIDSGSGSIKTAVATLDLHDGKLVKLEKENLDIKLGEDLEQERLLQEIISSGVIQNLYDTDDQPLNLCSFLLDQHEYTKERFYSDQSKAFLDSYVNKFSEAVKEKYLTSLTAIFDNIQKQTPERPTIGFLVGTAALRKADDGKNLVELLEKNIRQRTGKDTYFKIISQDDEGIYAFTGAVNSLKIDPEETISWDIGGGSMQITGKKGEDYEILKGVIASSTFQTLAMKMLDRKQKDSIYPLTADKVKEIIELGKRSLDFGKQKEDWFKTKKSQDTLNIVGVGNIHSSLLETMKYNHILDGDAKGYNHSDLNDLINLFTDKEKEQVAHMIPEKSKSYIENSFINAMLVSATMEKYDIDSVKVAEVSNIEAMVIEGVEQVVNESSLQKSSHVNEVDIIKPSLVKINPETLPYKYNISEIEFNKLDANNTLPLLKMDVDLAAATKLPDYLTQFQLAIALAKITGLDKVAAKAYNFVYSYFHGDSAPLAVDKHLQDINQKLYKRLMEINKIPLLIEEFENSDKNMPIDRKKLEDIYQLSKNLSKEYYDIKNPDQEELINLSKKVKKLYIKFIECLKNENDISTEAPFLKEELAVKPERIATNIASTMRPNSEITINTPQTKKADQKGISR